MIALAGHMAATELRGVDKVRDHLDRTANIKFADCFRLKPFGYRRHRIGSIDGVLNEWKEGRRTADERDVRAVQRCHNAEGMCVMPQRRARDEGRYGMWNGIVRVHDVQVVVLDNLHNLG